jgi:autotransporter-associated beta strand protein
MYRVHHLLFSKDLMMMSRSLFALVASGCLLLGSSTSSLAIGPYTWDGGGSTDNLLENLNWSDDIGPEDFQVRAGGNTTGTNIDTSIIFAGTTRLTPFVAASGWASDDAVPPAVNPDANSSNFYNNVSFDASAGSFVIGLGPGNTSGSLRLGPTAATTTVRTVQNDSSNIQTFNLPLIGAWVNVVANGGDVVFNSTYNMAVSSANRRLAVSGNFGLQLNAGITGAGVDTTTLGGFLQLVGPGKSLITASSASTHADAGGTGLWNGRVEITNGILEISHDTALGAGFANLATSGRTTVGTAVGNTGRLELAGDAGDDSISTSERIFLTGRSASFDSAATHIRNLHGSNTVAGPIESQNITNAQSVVIEASDDGAGAADLLTISGSITQRRAATTGLVLRGNGAGTITGNILNGATPATMTWDVHKLDGGTWTIGGAGNDYTGVTHVGAGTLTLGASASIANSSTLQIDNGATLNVSAQPAFTVGPTVAQVLKGDGTVTGNVAFTAGSSLVVDYNGSSIDSLSVTGALNITNATVDFNNLGSPLTAGSHVFATYGSLTGAAFANIVDLPAGFSINYNYLGGNQIALVASVHPGDFDSDGDVDGADFVAWQTNFPKPSGAVLAEGDADGDGDVDGADFVVWQTNFPFTPGPGAAPVPEPGAIVLAGFAAAAMALGVRRRRN